MTTRNPTPAELLADLDACNPEAADAARRQLGDVGPAAKANKYGVAPKADRTYNGVVYDSKAEMLRARELDVMKAGGGPGAVLHWWRQVTHRLGADDSLRVDFQVQDPFGRTWCEEIKGHETSDWRRKKRLWLKYGPMPLHVLKRRRGGWDREIVPAAGGMEQVT